MSVDIVEKDMPQQYCQQYLQYPWYDHYTINQKILTVLFKTEILIV